MAQHRVHYEKGCKTGQKTAFDRKIGVPLLAFHATKFNQRCEACSKAALKHGFDIQPEGD